mgnify:CR=1 FL=1
MTEISKEFLVSVKQIQKFKQDNAEFRKIINKNSESVELENMMLAISSHKSEIEQNKNDIETRKKEITNLENVKVLLINEIEIIFFFTSCDNSFS